MLLLRKFILCGDLVPQVVDIDIDALRFSWQSIAQQHLSVYKRVVLGAKD